MRSFVTFSDSTFGNSAAHAALTVARSPTTSDRFRRDTRPRRITSLLVVSADAQLEKPVERSQRPGRDAPILGLGELLPEPRELRRGPLATLHELPSNLEEGNVRDDVARPEVDRGRKPADRGSDQETRRRDED